MTWLDYALIGAFLGGMAMVGFRISRLIKNPDDIFVAGRELTPFVAAATITATNLSMFHFIGMGGTAYQSGISIIWQNWTGNMALVLSAILVIPVMRRLRVRSIPEFLEMRYSKSLRILIGAFWGLRLCVFLGTFLYVAATAAAVITGWDGFWPYVAWLFIFSTVAIMYSAIGGAWAVAIMDSVQFAFIIAGAMITFPIAMHLAGGGPSLIHWLQTHGKEVHTQLVPRTGEFGWLFVLAIMMASFKWATVDQAILQRAFGAKSPRAGAQAMVLSGLITTPLAFLWILPGVAMARIAVANHVSFANPDHAIPWLLSHQLPAIGIGLLGFVLCGLVAAQISTITADINSVATLFASDVYRATRRKEPSQRSLLWVARVSSVLCGALMMVVALILRQTGSGAVKANLTVVGAVDIPLFIITIVFGLFWKRTTWQGALAGFFCGGAAGISMYFLPIPAIASQLRNIVPFVSAGTAVVVTLVVSLLTNHDPKGETRQIWTHFHESTELGDNFHLVPESMVGRVGLVLIFGGFASFLAGVITAAASGLSFATTVALSGMCALFVGGLMRVYSR